MTSRVTELKIEHHFDTQKAREWLHFPSLFLVDQIVTLALTPEDMDVLIEGKFLAVNFGGTSLLIHLDKPDASESDQVPGPTFKLIQSLVSTPDRNR